MLPASCRCSKSKYPFESSKSTRSHQSVHDAPVGGWENLVEQTTADGDCPESCAWHNHSHSPPTQSPCPQWLRINNQTKATAARRSTASVQMYSLFCESPPCELFTYVFLSCRNCSVFRDTVNYCRLQLASFKPHFLWSMRCGNGHHVRQGYSGRILVLPPMLHRADYAEFLKSEHIGIPKTNTRIYFVPPPLPPPAPSVKPFSLALPGRLFAHLLPPD